MAIHRHNDIIWDDVKAAPVAQFIHGAWYVPVDGGKELEVASQQQASKFDSAPKYKAKTDGNK